MLVAIMCESYGSPPHKTLRLASLTASYCICGIAAVMSQRLWVQAYFITLGSLICAFVTLRLIQLAQNPPHPSRVATANLVCMCLAYPVVVCLWGLSDIYQVMPVHHEFLIETILMVIIKTVAFLYCLTDAEYTGIQNMIWEVPGQAFFIARSVLFNR
jgi:hypothetical protein